MSTQTDTDRKTDAGWSWYHINCRKGPALPPGTVAMSLCGVRFRARGRMFYRLRADHCPLCVAVGSAMGWWS